jgi:endonuclease-3
MTDSVRAEKILRLLRSEYTDRKPLIRFADCFQLAIAVILSAQCTDAQVNAVTPELFSRYPDAESLAGAGLPEIEEIVHSTGFFHQKARSIVGTARVIARDYHGRVPQEMEDLLRLPGIGRKSAHVIRGHCFDKPAIIVDTHFSRVTDRIGLVPDRDPVRIERIVGKLLPEERWTDFSMVINLHGRKVCRARRPNCPECTVRDLCDYPVKVKEDPTRSG